MADTLTGSQLARAAAYFSRHPQFLGHVLNATGKSDEDLCRLLACDMDTLQHACLCLRPRPERREEDLTQIASQLGLSRSGLASLTE